jgi:hypothetical protein
MYRTSTIGLSAFDLLVSLLLIDPDCRRHSCCIAGAVGISAAPFEHAVTLHTGL